MATLSLPVLVRNAYLDAITAYAGQGALLRIYDGTKPAVGAAITTQHQLAQLTFSGYIAPAASGGQLTFNQPASDNSADFTATATWARIVRVADQVVVCDMDVSANGGGGFLTLDNTSISLGGTVAITSGTFIAGNAT